MYCRRGGARICIGCLCMYTLYIKCPIFASIKFRLPCPILPRPPVHNSDILQVQLSGLT